MCGTPCRVVAEFGLGPTNNWPIGGDFEPVIVLEYRCGDRMSREFWANAMSPCRLTEQAIDSLTPSISPGHPQWEVEILGMRFQPRHPPDVRGVGSNLITKWHAKLCCQAIVGRVGYLVESPLFGVKRRFDHHKALLRQEKDRVAMAPVANWHNARCNNQERPQAELPPSLHRTRPEIRGRDCRRSRIFLTSYPARTRT